ncbi:hypothetical protein [Reichenbachiella sp.]|uniref:hypothetical protein n=1 Tax=Reichenbachiella sp. TaxID=2184521 RepID=UPI003BB06931
MVAILLLMIYTLVWMRPYFPYLEYALNKDYAILDRNSDKLDAGFTRCEDICYLEDQLAKYSQEEAPSELPNQQAKFGYEVLTHTLQESHNSLERGQRTLQPSGQVGYIQFYHSRSEDVASPPPKST